MYQAAELIFWSLACVRCASESLTTKLLMYSCVWCFKLPKIKPKPDCPPARVTVSLSFAGKNLPDGLNNRFRVVVASHLLQLTAPWVNNFLFHALVA